MNIKIDCAYDEIVPLEKLVPHPRNNNRHSIEQIQTLAKLINAHGFRYPIVVSKRSGFVVSGHGRIEALRYLKEEAAPVDFQDFSSEAEEYQVLTSDNEIARWSELDYQAIYDALKEIPDIDVSLLGIDDFKLPEINNDTNEITPKRQLTPEEEDILCQAWAQWCSEMIDTISLLETVKIFSQNLSPAYLKIYFLRALFLGERFPRGATTARQYHRMFCSGDGDNGSIVDLLQKITTDPEKAKRLRYALQERPSMEKLITVSGVAMAGHKAPLDFPAELAKSLYNEFADGGRVLDPCHGWGGRLIGFLLSNAKSYKGIDASPDTNGALKNIAQDLEAYHNKEVELRCSPFEDVPLEKDHYDFAMTSPPYFDRERYIGGDQAHERYKTYEEFIEGFYTAMIKKVYRALRSEGIFALQVGNQKYDLDTQAIKIAKKIGFVHLETRDTNMTGVGADEDEEVKEVLLIFKKVITIV